MTGIWALLPADHAAAVWAAVNTHAETTREPGDERTADQRRADSLTELMTAYLDGTCPSTVPGNGSQPTADPPRASTGPAGADPSAADPSTGNDTATGHDTVIGDQAGIGDNSATGNGAGIGDDSAAGDDTATGEGIGTEPAAGLRPRLGRRGCDAPGGHRQPTVPSWCRVQLKVSADWLLGTSTEAPVLTGHGPLPADVALRLIADARWQRIVHDPLTGALLDVETTVHDPPPALREHVLVRDGGCTQPICGNSRVDLDHNVPFPHGPTSAGNLRSRCRHHHHLKQHPQWQARAGPDGRIEWIAPTGHAYPEHGPDLRPGSTTRPRPDPDIGPDPPPDQADRPGDSNDPPPF